MLCLQISWISFLIMTFWLWKESVIPGQLLLQSGCSLLTLIFGLGWIFKLKQKYSPSVMSLTPTGEVNWLQGAHHGYCKLSHQSKICGAFICLFFEKTVFDNQPRFLWLAKDQVSEQDFRRLCRIILRCQQQPMDC
ncbi:MAG: protein YgfX [Aliiglaciecola sp.]|uniref:protein YgfX n=1 Tax=Aliiglaciecola sp. TaxID=1872441 RepID=UPI00329A0349